MTSLPEEAVSTLWRQMGEIKNWSNFMKAAMNLCGRTDKLDVMTVDYLVREAYDLKQINVQFPETPTLLYQVLHDRLSQNQA